MSKRYKTFIIASLVLVYLVILAGAVVRMTGSGMGCPDWPKCFGYLIPPTERHQLDWKPNHSYHKGEVIILNESLQVAENDFQSNETFNPNHWKPYTKHDYALFNPVHTWIEFINRLLGALAGLSTLLLLFSALSRFRVDRWATVGSLLVVLGMGFQAWLGKTVVDSNLLHYKITLHMAMALLIVFLLVVLLSRERKMPLNLPKTTPFKSLIVMALVLTLIQVGMGTQVRQFIDIQMKNWNLAYTELWLEHPPSVFFLHRSFSIAVLLIHLYLVFLFIKNKNFPRIFSTILLLLGLEIGTGILMYYFNFPFSSQPLHLVLASLLFGVQSYLVIEAYKKS